MSEKNEASLLKANYDQLSEIIKKQWKNLSIGAVILIVAFLVAVLTVLVMLRPSDQTEALAALSKSSVKLAEMAEGVLAGCFAGQSLPTNLDPKREAQCREAITIIREQKAIQVAVSEKIQAEDRRTSPEALSFLQLLGGTAVLAMLGYLGLARLQNLDAELGALRSFVFEQVKSRVEELKSVVRADVTVTIENEVAEGQKSIGAAVEEAKRKVDAVRSGTEVVISDAVKLVGDINSRLTATIKKYPWLGNEALRQSLASLSSIQSVQKAHDLAEKLREKGDPESAIAVLRVIVENSLPGDKDDFHNAHAEAMRLQNHSLSLEIVEEGLKYFPDDYDLKSDEAIVLLHLGKPVEAKLKMDSWRQRSPSQFARGWRPIVFYSRVVQAVELTQESKSELLDAFALVVQQSPYEDKAWSAYARFLFSIGDVAAAEAVLVSALEKNVYSQELHFVYGEFLLRCGRSEEAVIELEKAVRTDYQDQFQPDVSQPALFAMLAQAYEAAGRPAQAKPIYLSLKENPNTIGRYASQRIAAIALMEGEVHPVGLVSAGAGLMELANLMAKLQNKEADSEDE